MKSIVSKIRNIRNSPEKTRKKIMWASVAVCMVLVASVWLAEFFGKKDRLMDLGDINYNGGPNLGGTIKKIDNIGNEKDKVLDNVAFELEKIGMAELGIKYIDDNKVLNGIGIDDIKLAQEERADGIWTLEFRQLYKDVPVELSGIVLLIGAEDKNAKIEKNIYFSDIELDINPKISQEEALENIKNAIKEKNAVSKKSEIVIYTDGSKEKARHRLAWKINVYNEEPFFGATYFVDAGNGEILDSENDQ